MTLGFGSMPCVCNQDAKGTASTASPKMPFSRPIEVMPIWIVDRKRVGSATRRDAEAASASPSLASAARRGARAVSSATSDMASRPFSMIRLPRITKSIPSPSSAPEHDLQHEAAADVREQQQHEAAQRPAQRHAAAPAVQVAPGEQQREGRPGDEREQRLV